MDINKVLEDINSIKKLNPNIDIKINTVVSSLNKLEDLSGFIKEVNPNKWKVFKVLPVTTHEHDISQSEFLAFLQRHRDLADIISSENNDEMTDSYLMIDPIGRFFQNSNMGKGYIYSRPITQIGIHKALNEINFDVSRFHGRYEKSLINLLEVT
jgi:radical S-adenosyl methionine domain-containing protein 2